MELTLAALLGIGIHHVEVRVGSLASAAIVMLGAGMNRALSGLLVGSRHCNFCVLSIGEVGD